MATGPRPRVALVWHGDRNARVPANLDENRLRGVAQALRNAGIEPVAAVYNDDFAGEVRDQLLQVDGVLVWVNPIEQGADRSSLDRMLREVAAAGVFVSAHPDTILKMGTKEVLYRTRDMSWGSDTGLYRTPAQMRQRLPLRLASGESRVLKQNRGNGGNGVWQVTLLQEQTTAPEPHIRVRHALRGSLPEEMPLAEFLQRCEGYFANGGQILDQPYQERLAEGMIRCYLVGNSVAGFGEQKVNALYPPPPGGTLAGAPEPGPRLYYPPTRPDLQPIRRLMEDEWLPALQELLALQRDDLPVIWDADLLYGPRNGAGEDTYVLCEINVSSVYPFPDEALEPLARETLRRVRR